MIRLASETVPRTQAGVSKIGYLADVWLGLCSHTLSNAAAQGTKIHRPTGRSSWFLDGARVLHPESSSPHRILSAQLCTSLRGSSSSVETFVGVR